MSRFRLGSVLATLALALVAGGAAFAQDDDDDVPAKDAAKKDEYDTTSDEAKALKDKLSVDPKYKDGQVHLSYDFTEVDQNSDWTAKGFDNFGIADSNLTYTNQALNSMYMGASPKGGIVTHSLDLVGDYEITISMEMPRGGAVTRFSDFAILLGFKKKPSIGVRWGAQLVKVKKNLSMRPITKNPPEHFKGGQKVKVTIVRKGDEVSLKLNGRKVGSRKLKKGKDLDGKVGFVAKDLQMNVLEMTIVGTPDPKKLK